MAALRNAFDSGHLLAFYFIVLSCISFVEAVSEKDRVYIKGTGIDGVRRELDVSRYPALYTGDFGDCLESGSLFNISKFDAAYYADNATVLFHLDGTTNIPREDLMLHISVSAYGESRFNLTYDPCKANMRSLCPLKATRPIAAFAVIPIAPRDVTGIPSVALGIPDLEAYARLRIFANSTQSEIGCFQAVMTNGNSFSQPKSVGSFLGAMAVCAVIASSLTAIYGIRVPAMRIHYAHSLSVLVIFEAYHSIFFSGALSVDWPSVLPAWWSNFAWSTGMFASARMTESFVGTFAGSNGNLSQVGRARPFTAPDATGDLTQEIYEQILGKRWPLDMPLASMAFSRRAAYNASDPYDYTWHGDPQLPGLPISGTYPGFAGTLSKVDIPPAEAFTIALIWLVVLLAAVVLFTLLTKVFLDLLIRLKWTKTDGFDFFRKHVWGYAATGLLRTLIIAFFAIMTLATYQFTLFGPAGPTALAGVTWTLMFLFVVGMASDACFVRLRHGEFRIEKDATLVRQRRLLGRLTVLVVIRESCISEEEKTAQGPIYASIPTIRIQYVDKDPNRLPVHEDEWYIMRSGWLSARYRRTRWWAFIVYLGYQFVRATFIGGGSGSPRAQVYGLFVFEVVTALLLIKFNPFEGSRNTAVSVWMLSISKIVTAGLSIAFLPAFKINRIVATVLGIVIVVVQGFLTLAILILIVLGSISTWMSLSRNREDFATSLEQTRIKYFEHLETRARDLPGPTKSKARNAPVEAIEPYFKVHSVHRTRKIYDECEDLDDDRTLYNDVTESNLANERGPERRRSRANSASSRLSTSGLPRAARVHRASWSSKDFSQWDEEMSRQIGPNRSRSLKISTGRYSDPRFVAEPNATSPRRPMTPAREIAEHTELSDLGQAVGDLNGRGINGQVGRTSGRPLSRPTTPTTLGSSGEQVAIADRGG